MHAFTRIGGGAVNELNDTLREAAEPVRFDAQLLAYNKIRNMPRSPEWASMRVGISANESIVYVVPFMRGSRNPRSKRTNLANLLMDRAMLPALDRNAPQIERDVNKMLDELADENGF